MDELHELEQQHYTVRPISELYPEIWNIYGTSADRSTDRGRAAFLLGAYFESLDFRRASDYYAEAHLIAISNNNLRLLSDSLHPQALIALRAGDTAIAIELEEQALELAQNLGHQYRVAFCYFMLGSIALGYGSHEKAVDLLNRSLVVSNGAGFKKLQVRLYSQLAELQLVTNDTNKARAFAEGSIRLGSELSLFQDVVESQVRLASIELVRENYPRVLELVSEVRSTLPKENHSLWCVTHTLLGNVHAAKSKLKLAEGEFKSSLKLADYPNCERVRSNVHVHLAELYLRMKNKSGALKEALAALKDAEKAQDAFCRKETLRTIHNCYKALGKYKEAHHYLEKYNDLVAESDAALLKNRLEYHELRNEFEKEKLESAEKTRAAELLRLELRRKEQELTEKTRHLIKQTEALTQFRDDLRALIRRSPSDDPLVHQIRERLQSLPESQLNWEDFDEMFNAVHPKFLHNLIKDFPALTAMERKLCVLLRLELTSTDMAKLLFLSERSIENHRYRIRKKLCLSQTKSLHEFLSKY